MKIVKNERLIKRNGTIGRTLNIAALVSLGLGMYFSFQTFNSKDPGIVWYPAIGLALGFTLTTISMFFMTRWGVSPRPDERLDAALKGLPGDTALYHYVTPVAHLLVGPAGLWVLETRQLRGKVTYAKNRWRLSGGGFMQGYMSIFGQEGLGRPDLDAAAEINSLRKYLAKQLEDAEIPDIRAALVLTNDQMEIDAPDAPMPALRAKQLKDFMRQQAKEHSLGPLQLQKIRSVLPAPE